MRLGGLPLGTRNHAWEEELKGERKPVQVTWRPSLHFMSFLITHFENTLYKLSLEKQEFCSSSKEFSPCTLFEKFKVPPKYVVCYL